MVDRVVAKLIAPLKRRIMLTVSRGVIDLVNDSLKEQGVQIKLLDGEIRTVERYQEYGFSSVPHRGAEAVAVFVGGNRDHGMVIATGDRRYRLKGQKDGEVAIWDDQGQKVHLKRGKEIEVAGCDKLTANVATQTTITCPDIKFIGALDVTGPITSQTSISDPTGSMQDMRDDYNGHNHPGGGVPAPQM